MLRADIEWGLKMKQAGKVKIGLLAVLLAGAVLPFHSAHAQHGGGHFGGSPGGGGHFGGPGPGPGFGGGWHGGGPGGWGGGGWRGGGPWGWGGNWGWGGGWGGYYGGGWPYSYYYGGYPGYGAWNPYWGNPYWAGWGWGWSMPYVYGRTAYTESYGGSYPQYEQPQPPAPPPNAVPQVGGQVYAPASYYASPDYGQYPPTANTMPPPSNMAGSDGTAMFNCKDGYFYNNLTQNCDKR
ncbi:hypothetical protein [Acetobacter syzygii]|uniref:hypothetical protein n=1 Tax=Acetobacter syzygii TaxID=146476 RepID=UPI0020C65487|nr:hypothetical protein [Acetobacter syzygii]